MTGRLANWPGSVRTLPLDRLDPQSARDFLLERTQRGRQTRPDDTVQAGALAQELDGYALALEQAGAFVGCEHSTLADYLARWRRNDRRVQGWHDAWLMDYPRPLATTWQTSAEILPETARALLDTIAWLGSEPLPRSLFCETGEDAGSAGRIARRAQSLSGLLAAQSPDAPLDLEESLARLAELSLLQAAPADFDSPGRLHRVLALMIRAAQTPERAAAARAAALALADTVAVGDPMDVRDWPVWVPLAPHLGALLAEDRDGAGGVESCLLNELGKLLYAQARYAEAEPLKRRSLAIDERVHGPDHPRVAIHLNNLAQLLKATNRLAEAEPLMRRALDIDERAYGPDHPSVSRDLNNLAALLQATNRLAEAEPLMRRALAIDERTYGSDHPDVAIDLNNLAQLLQATNRLAEAEPLMRRALAIDERASGPDHPRVAIVLNNLAQLLQATNRLAEAEPPMRRALAIAERAYGPDHPDVATDLNNLAQLLTATSRLAEAEPPMRRALVILLQSTAATGHRLPDLDPVQANYAALLAALGLDPADSAARITRIDMESGVAPAPLPSRRRRSGWLGRLLARLRP
jgi:tetratricopeptide (TPR) repeat protein